METTDIHSAYERERGKPMPSKNHNRIQHRLNVELAKRYDQQYDFLPEQDLELATGRAVPDLAIYPNLTYDWMNDTIRMTDPPLTTIEILSPEQALTDLTDKIQAVYFPAGVKSCWVVIPPLQTVYILAPNQPIATFTVGIITDPATGISLNIEDIFQ